MNNLLLKFPVRLIGNYIFNDTDITNSYYYIYVHIHSFVVLTIKINNFLFNVLNYKIKLYNFIIKNSSNYINLINKSNKKIRSQKKLGKSRIGSLKSSLHRGGGVIFGPYPRYVNIKINTKEWNKIYKSIFFNKRYNILWFYIQKLNLNYTIVEFYNTLLRNLGIYKKNKISFFITSKYLYNKNVNNISIIKFLIMKYIFYLI